MLVLSRRAAVAAIVAICGCSEADPAREPVTIESPAAVASELLEADRAFAAASAQTDLVSGLTAMFADSVAMRGREGKWVEGDAAAAEFLRATPGSATARAEWTPVRAGVSADGSQGFTYGYMTVHLADTATVPMKYLSYWVRQPEGWRVVAYRRTVRPAGPVSLTPVAPALPESLARRVIEPDSARAAAIALIMAEQTFSDDAQVMGLGAAFEKHGSADAVNLGGPDDTTVIVGAARIGRSIGAGAATPGSPVSWRADRVIVASSGDLGVTFGFIRTNGDPTAQQVPFFTVWRRAAPGEPWRYIAE